MNSKTNKILETRIALVKTSPFFLRFFRLFTLIMFAFMGFHSYDHPFLFALTAFSDNPSIIPCDQLAITACHIRFCLRLKCACF